MQENYNVEKCNTSFNEVKPHSHFFTMALVFHGETPFLQKNCLEDKIIPAIKNHMFAEIQYANKRNTSLDEAKPCHVCSYHVL